MIASPEYNDEVLFRLISEDHSDAFHVFFHRYNRKVYYFILHMVKSESLAEELTQDVFLKLWTGRASLSGVRNAGNYLFVMAKNGSLDQLEKMANQSNLQQSFFLQHERQSNCTEEHINYRDSHSMVANAVQLLPEQQRIVYQLSKEQGLSRSQIASILQVSPHTVKNHLGVALHTIRRYINRQDK